MTDPLIAGGRDETDYRYEGAMRWTPEVADEDDEGVEPGTPEFEAAAFEGLASNPAIHWSERNAAAMQVIAILRAAGRRLRIERDAARKRLDAIAAMHTPVAGEGDTRWCDVCSQDEEQPQPIGWWVPWPCPTREIADYGSDS